MKRNLKRFAAFAAAVFLLAGSAPAGAAELANGEELFSGYLFQMKADAASEIGLMAEDGESGITAVIPDEAVYRAEDMKTLARYVDLDMVAYVEPDYYAELYGAPDDPYYADQTGPTSQWYLNRIGMEYAWKWGLDGRGVRIAVIDSGLYSEHEDLQRSNARAMRNFYTPDDRVPTVDESDVSDVHGHGTFVTGMLNAETNNGKHIASIAPGAEVFMLKCFAQWTDSAGSIHTTAKVSDLSVTIRAAVDEFQCRVINMSFGIYEEAIDPSTEGDLLPTLKKAIDYAADKGTILVAAMGNDYGAATKKGWHSYPACFDNVVGVGATNYEDNIYSGSQQNEKVWVVAPGQNMTSLSMGSVDGIKTYGLGTSYATPCVTGVAALVKSVDPGVDAEQFMSLLSVSSKDMGKAGFDTTYGYGLVNIPSLFQSLVDSVDETPRVVPTETGVRVTADYFELPAQDSAVVMAAGYLANGRMVAVNQTAVTVNSWRTRASVELALPVPVDEVRVFLLDGDTGKPLVERRMAAVKKTA